jgi:uncharacterized protein
MNIELNLTACYADNYNESVINYNGEVFKCTARGFTTTAPDGILSKERLIHWNISKLLERIDLRLPSICESCNLLPACSGICSQKRLEEGDKVQCVLDKQFTKEDYIIHNLNKQFLLKKIQLLQ